jgi:hypothetical protein
VRHFFRWLQAEGETDRDATSDVDLRGRMVFVKGKASRLLIARLRLTATCR